MPIFKCNIFSELDSSVGLASEPILSVLSKSRTAGLFDVHLAQLHSYQRASDLPYLSIVLHKSINPWGREE